MKVAQTNEVPAVGPVPAADTVLVLAPHMDDETIGCGGAIIAHVKNGASVHVLFLTDGAKGFEPHALQAMTDQERQETRVRESEAACQVMGVTKTHYLNLPDGQSQATPEAVAQFGEILKQVQPDLLYLPFLTDTHHDHRVCNALLFAASRNHPELDRLLVNCFEVWTPLHPNHIVDITADMEQKMAALACYVSQLDMNNYLSSVQGLNAYRAIANRSQGFAEAFYLTTVGDYRALAENL